MYVIMLKTIENILNTVEKIFLQILFVAMTLVVLIAVFNRITVNAQMAWSDELSRYLFVWLTFIAAAYAAGGKAHIGVTALVDIFPPAMKRVVELLTYLLGLGLSFILVYFTAIIMRTQIQYGQISPSLRLPMQYAYAGMAVGGIFMAIHFLLHICNFFAKPNSEEKGE